MGEQIVSCRLVIKHSHKLQPMALELAHCYEYDVKIHYVLRRSKTLYNATYTHLYLCMISLPLTVNLEIHPYGQLK